MPLHERRPGCTLSNPPAGCRAFSHLNRLIGALVAGIDAANKARGGQACNTSHCDDRTSAQNGRRCHDAVQVSGRSPRGAGLAQRLAQHADAEQELLPVQQGHVCLPAPCARPKHSTVMLVATHGAPRGRLG